MAVSIARGKRIFLFFATLVMIFKLLSLASTFSNGFGQVKWFKTVIPAIGVLCCLYFYSKGDSFFRIFLGLIQTVSGLAMAYLCIRMMIITAKITKPENSDFFFQVIGIPVGLILLFALFELAMGLTLFFSPSVKAYLNKKRDEELVKQYISVMDDDEGQSESESR